VNDRRSVVKIRRKMEVWFVKKEKKKTFKMFIGALLVKVTFTT